MSTLNVSSLQSNTTNTPVVFKDSTGNEVGQLVRAWVNFNGTGTVAIRASFNVLGITDNGTGDYTVNFANALPDTNFATNVTGNFNTNGNQVVMAALWPFSGTGNPQTTSSVRVLATPTGTNAGGQIDLHHMNVSVFR